MAHSTLHAHRRLTAIFCADVAGYTRLMNGDEGGALRLLTSHRAITDRQIEQFGGRIANTAGDSILAEFPSAVDALQCALAIQERIAIANQEVPEPRRIVFRIGIHVGEVIVRGGDLFGDGVNIAARLQSLAQPGTVCVSGAAYEFVHRLLPLVFEDLGERSVKNVDGPVRAYLTRPSGEPPPKALPPAHRHNEFYLVRRLQRLFMQALEQIADEVDLEGIDCPLLATIDEAPGLGIGALAERAAVDLPVTEESVKRLERRGLLRSTDPSGLDTPSLTLTPSGVEVRMRIRARFLAAQDRMMAPLSDRERDALKDLLSRVIKANSSEAGG